MNHCLFYRTFFRVLQRDFDQFTKNPEEIQVVPYFAAYANLLLVMAKIMKPLCKRYRDQFQQDLEVVMNAAEKIRYRWPHGQENFDGAESYIRENFQPLFEAWNKQLQVPRDYSVKSGERVMLKTSDDWYWYWLSCSQYGTFCGSRTCPGDFGLPEGCHSEHFRIFSIGKSGPIRNCDMVAILSGDTDSTGYWLSHKFSSMATSTCPGIQFTPNKILRCYSEAWKIIDDTRACGTPIQEQDKFFLQVGNTSRKLKLRSHFRAPTFSTLATQGSKFIVFKDF